MYDWDEKIDRVKLALMGGKVDRPPFMIFGLEQMITRIMGCTIQDLYNDAEFWANAAIKTQEFFNSDIPLFAPDPALITAEAFGAKFIHRKYLTSTATPEDRLIKNPEDVDNLEIPDPSKDGLYPTIIAAYKHLKEKTRSPFLDWLFFSDLTWGPIQQMRGKDAWTDFYMNPDLLPKLAEKVFDSNLNYFKHWSDELGSTPAAFNISYLGNKDMASYKDFWEIEGKWVKKFRRKTGMAIILHNCGRQPYWEEMIKDIKLFGVNPTFTSQGNSDVNYWKKIKEDYKVYVFGTINQIGATLTGSVQDVEKEVMDNMEALAPGGKFILTHGCEVGWGVPLENLSVIKTCADKFAEQNKE